MPGRRRSLKPSGSSEASSLGAYVLARLRSDILSAQLRPGMKLSINLLSESYEVGIGPIREALTVLSGDGLVSFERQRGFRVAAASKADFVDIAETRRRIECMTLALSIARGDEAWRDYLCEAKRCYAAVAERVGDRLPITEEWETHHRAYHIAMLLACGSETLLRFCVQLHDRYDRYRRMAIPQRALMAGVAVDHDEIMKAALARDIAGAVAILERHIDDTTAIVLDHLPADSDQ